MIVLIIATDKLFFCQTGSITSVMKNIVIKEGKTICRLCTKTTWYCCTRTRI